MSHTPTPWRAHKALVFSVGSSHQYWIASTDSAYASDKEAPANAAFIVKAVNAHDDLVKALSEIHAHSVNEPGYGGSPTEQRVIAALEKAGVTP